MIQDPFFNRGSRALEDFERPLQRSVKFYRARRFWLKKKKDDPTRYSCDVTILDHDFDVVDALSTVEHSWKPWGETNQRTCIADQAKWAARVRQGIEMVGGQVAKTFGDIEKLNLFSERRLKRIRPFFEIPINELFCKHCKQKGVDTAKIIPFTGIAHMEVLYNGTVYKDLIRLIAFKKGALDLFREEIGSALSRNPGPLRGCRFTFKRVGEKSAAVGDTFSFIQRYDENELFDLFGKTKQMPEEWSTLSDSEIRKKIAERHLPEMWLEASLAIPRVEFSKEKGVYKISPLPIDYKHEFRPLTNAEFESYVEQKEQEKEDEEDTPF